MSVEPHRHCQATVLSVNGTGNQNGSTWNNTIGNLNLPNIRPTNWKTKFTENKNNISQDLASILELIDETHDRIKNVEGSAGLLKDSEVVCYIAPKQEYFHSNSGETNTYTEYTEETETYYTLNGSSQNFSYAYKNNGVYRIYPGNDSNLENQYAASAEEKKKYPLFSLNAAMEYLRRFRANGKVTYIVQTQFGEYDFGSQAQTISHIDATGASDLLISPRQTKDQLGSMPCLTKNYASAAFNDTDVAKVIFKWSDHINGGSEQSPNLYLCTFDTSSTTVEGIVFKLYRVRTTENYKISGATVLNIAIKSGKVTFKQCVFRNVTMGANQANTPSPEVWFGTKFRRNEDPPAKSETASPQFNMSNIQHYQYPCVFVDDEPISNLLNTTNNNYYKSVIKSNYIGAGISDSMKYVINGYLIIFASRYGYSQFYIRQTNSLVVRFSYSTLTKILLVYKHAGTIVSSNIDPSKYCLIDNQAMTTVSYGNTSTPSTAVNSTINTQFRIEIVNKNGTTNIDPPSWLYDNNVLFPSRIFSNSYDGYDKDTGAYNQISGILMSEKEEQKGIICYNDSLIITPSKIILNKEGGTGGTDIVYPIYGQQFPLVYIPSRPSCVFLGYYNGRTGNIKYYREDGLGLYNWQHDEYYTLNVYAQWGITIIFNANGGSVTTTSKTVTIGKKYGTLPTPTWSGHNFQGWYTAATSGTNVNGETIATIEDARTLYAHWS